MQSFHALLCKLIALCFYFRHLHGYVPGDISSVISQQSFKIGDSIVVYVNVFTPDNPVNLTTNATDGGTTGGFTTGAVDLTSGIVTGTGGVTAGFFGPTFPSYCHLLVGSTGYVDFVTSGQGAAPVTTDASALSGTGTGLPVDLSTGGATGAAPGTTLAAAPGTTRAVSTTSVHYPLYNGTGPPGQGVYRLPNGQLISCSPPVPPPPPPVTGCEFDTSVQRPDYISFFYPTLDDFSSMEISGSGAKFTASQYKVVRVSVTVSSAGKNHTSPVRLYKDSDNYGGLYSTIFTGLVNLNNGEVCNVAWDDDCSQCVSNECIGDTQCGVSIDDGCSDSNGNNCNIQIFLAFVGQDNRGIYCTSANKIPSRFQKYALTPVYRAAAGITQERFFGG